MVYEHMESSMVLPISIFMEEDPTAFIFPGSGISVKKQGVAIMYAALVTREAQIEEGLVVLMG